GTAWSERLPLHRPPPRYDHALAHDFVGQVTLLFGGRPAVNAVAGGTWLWDGNDWRQAAGPEPSARCNHAMSSDILRGRVVLFGGFGSSTFGDTWEWDGTSWSQRPTGPGPAPHWRASHAMAFDLARAVTVMNGGTFGGEETWEWDGASWAQQVSTARDRVGHAIAFDARLQRVIRVGGAEGSPPVTLPDTDSYGHPVLGSWQSHGVGCQGSLGMPQLQAPTSVVPGPMIGHPFLVQLHGCRSHAFFAFGWSDSLDGATPLPHDLTGLGMPGCALRVSRDAIAGAVPMNGVATLQQHVPNDPFLVGLGFHVQGMSLDPGVNVGGFVLTNGLQASIGRY
ncbi:MAG: hypothetical protein KDC98_08625, partial [Planctomycetes bacterium]|nr:hypothetical protein [Planctomycetota bacterium]